MTKKLLSFLFLGTLTSALTAQENELKNLRFGGDFTGSINWYKPDDLKKFESAGTTVHGGGALICEFRLASNFAINFGLGIGTDGGKISFTDTANASYILSDDAFFSHDNNFSDTAGLKYTYYRLNERKYKATYFNIPVGIKMRTKEIGMMRYFLQIGFNTGIRKKVKCDDDVTRWDGGATSGIWTKKEQTDQKDLDVTKDMAIMKFSANVFGGAEYYISGSTALVFGLAYDYGLSNVVQHKSEFLIRSHATTLEQKFNANAFQLRLGLLF